MDCYLQSILQVQGKQIQRKISAFKNLGYELYPQLASSALLAGYGGFESLGGIYLPVVLVQSSSLLSLPSNLLFASLAGLELF